MKLLQLLEQNKSFNSWNKWRRWRKTSTFNNDKWAFIWTTSNNPLRGNSTFTNITNLEVPKVEFSLDDDDFIKDGETAKELEASADTITFGRNKFKVFAQISETVLHGTNTNLVSTVETALESGLAAKEKKSSICNNKYWWKIILL